MSYSVLRRYTPPTCTLEIMAKNSPLSRWAGQPVLKNLRFHLSLDDPKLPKEQWTTLQGDRVQLEALCEAVQTYVQNFLEQSHNRLNLTFLRPQAEAGVISIAAPQQDFVSPSPAAGPDGILLQPRGMLSHDLVLGSLATEESGPVTHLSTLQLFDLANALDDYTTEVLTLPSLPQSSWLKPARPWGQAAAAAVLLVAVSASIIRVFDGATNIAKSTAPTTSAGASSSDQRIANQLPPAATNPSGVPSPPIALNPTLPPPPPLGSTTPSGTPGLPTVTLDGTAPVAPETNPPAKPQIIAKATQPQTQAGKQPTTIPGDPVVVGKATQPEPPNVKIAESPPREALSLPAPSLKRSGNEAAELRSAPAQADGIAAESQPETAFDTIPQVAEVRNYFQQRWKAPEGLTQTLEYQLMLDANGAVQSIVPLGQASGDYIDRTGIPLRGEPFVSPLQQGTTAKIRLVLSPDGGVQTFQIPE